MFKTRSAVLALVFALACVPAIAAQQEGALFTPGDLTMTKPKTTQAKAEAQTTASTAAFDAAAQAPAPAPAPATDAAAGGEEAAAAADQAATSQAAETELKPPPPPAPADPTLMAPPPPPAAPTVSNAVAEQEVQKDAVIADQAEQLRKAEAVIASMSAQLAQQEVLGLYEVVSPLTHDGEHYPIGKPVRLTARQAQPLLGHTVVEADD